MFGSNEDVRPPGPVGVDGEGLGFGAGCSGAAVARITPETMPFNAVGPRCATALNNWQLRRAGPCHSAVVYSHATQSARPRQCDWQAAVDGTLAIVAIDVPVIWIPASTVEVR